MECEEVRPFKCMDDWPYDEKIVYNEKMRNAFTSPFALVSINKYGVYSEAISIEPPRGSNQQAAKYGNIEQLHTSRPLAKIPFPFHSFILKMGKIRER